MKKILYIVLDGLGDDPIPELGNKTPLEASLTPNMDKLAERGKCGLMYTVGKGIAPESDIAVISILGYDAKKYYTGRGPLESLASGLTINDGDLAYRVNFATLGEGKNLKDRRAGRTLTTEEAKALSDQINAKVKLTSIPADFEFKSTIGHRGVLAIRAKDRELSSAVTNTDPAYEKEGPFGVAKEEYEMKLAECFPEPGYENDQKAKAAARLTNEFIEKSSKVLNESEINKKRIERGQPPANVILTRDAGDRLPKMPSMKEQFGINMGCFVEMPVEQGIVMLTGMTSVESPKAETQEETYHLWAKKIIETVPEFDGLYIHIKGPDEPAHDGDYQAKKEIIELIDRAFFTALLEGIKLEDFIVTVTADHSTSCLVKAHTDKPVPVLITGGKVDKDETKKFSEEACREGSLGIINGTELMPLLVKYSRSR
jgi:2,3-bisphosphoglycerate-independent phosphoglycerate mutase